VVKVKICGITNIKDALMCVDAGADALGFVFYKDSPRKVSILESERILKRLPPIVEKIAVVVDYDSDLLLRLHNIGFRAFQCYFQIQENLRALLPDSVFIQAYRVLSRPNVKTELIDAVLIDAYDSANVGGTGKAIDWDMARSIREEIVIPMFLAGGLCPENIGEAVQKVRPYAVDASSRLEIEPGKKDEKKVREFIHNAKCAC